MFDSAERAVQLLKDIYASVLERCAPDVMLRDALRSGRVAIPEEIESIVAIGKCAVPLARAAAELTGVGRGLVIHPDGYETRLGLPDGLERVTGSHPVPSNASAGAARRALEFVSAQKRPILFLVSGGASACLEDGLVPQLTLDTLVGVNRRLLASGMPIDRINTVRRHLSSVKGGRLGAAAPAGSVSLVYSDVPPGRPDLVGSGPTANDPTTLSDAAAILRELGDVESLALSRLLEERRLPETPKTSPTRLEVIADSEAMIEAAADECAARGIDARRGPSLDGDVALVARELASEAAALCAGQMLLSAGEPTVVVRGDGTGGRCTELAVRYVLESDSAGEHSLAGLFGSSDGRDGSSPAAAVIVRPADALRLDRARASEALRRSASYELVADCGEPIIMMPTGNNLRDIALTLRGR